METGHGDTFNFLCSYNCLLLLFFLTLLRYSDVPISWAIGDIVAFRAHFFVGKFKGVFDHFKKQPLNWIRKTVSYIIIVNINFLFVFLATYILVYIYIYFLLPFYKAVLQSKKKKLYGISLLFFSFYLLASKLASK